MTETVLHNPRQEWQTPQDFFDQVNKEFQFAVDVCATPNNAKCSVFIPPELDALQVDWHAVWPTHRYWCNPGFANLDPWCQKMHHEVRRSSDPDACGCVLGLLSAAPWLTHYCYLFAKEIRILYPRVQFVPADGIKRSSNSRDNVLIVFDNKVHDGNAVIYPWYWK